MIPCSNIIFGYVQAISEKMKILKNIFTDPPGIRKNRHVIWHACALFINCVLSNLSDQRGNRIHVQHIVISGQNLIVIAMR